VFLELGWNNGYNIDEEHTENKARRMVQEEVERMQRDIRKFNRVVGREIEQRESMEKGNMFKDGESSHTYHRCSKKADLLSEPHPKYST
jgi:hypothetical protein